MNATQQQTSSALSYSAAREMAVKLKSEGYTYEKLAKLLKKEGYVSQKTGRPISSGGVRLMITTSPFSEVKPEVVRRKRKEEATSQEQESSLTIAVKEPHSPEQELVGIIRQLLDTTGIEAHAMLNIISTLVVDFGFAKSKQ